MSFERPYEGIKVVDLSQGIAGPYCAMLLAQWGADVIKVEPPVGDWTRILGPRYGEHTAFSLIGNIGKRSLCLDLKQDEAKAALKRVLKDADVFLEGFRPGVIDRLGFGYEVVKEIAPSVVYISISGYGQTGPLSRQPAMDPVLQAFTGFMHANRGADGVPLRTQPIIVDMTTSMFAHQAVAAALYAKRNDPSPRFLDISLMQGAAHLQGVRMTSTLQEGQEPPPGSTPGGVYRCSDGYLQVLILQERDWLTFCDAFGFDDWKAEEKYRSNAGRVADIDEINARIIPIFKSKSTAEWNALFSEKGLMNEVINDYLEFADHPHPNATCLFAKLPQPGYPEPTTLLNIPGLPALEPGMDRANAPVIGSDTAAILAENGLTTAEAAALLASGAAKEATA